MNSAPKNFVPSGLVDCTLTPFDSNNNIDLETFARIVEFLMKHNASSICVNLHLAESLNLSLDERKQLAAAAVEASNQRVPVIVNVSTPGTDHAVELAKHAENSGADAIMAIPPYYWKPPQEGVEAHFRAILSATGLPFIGYNSPMIMDGVGIAPETLMRLMDDYPQFVGLKDASHNWEIFLELGRAARSRNRDFGMFVGTEWVIPSLTLGGTACMSVFGGVAPNFVKRLYDLTKAGNLEEALKLQYIYSELYQTTKVEYPAPTKAMWEIMGRPIGGPRLPNRPVSAARRQEIEALLNKFGFLDSEPQGW